MASSTSSAQIHILGTSSLKKPNCAHSRTLCLGNSSSFGFSRSSAFLKLKSNNTTSTTRRGYSVRVVNEKVVGIDLGTTNSVVAVMEGGKPIIITNAEDQRTTPSVVAYTKNGDRLVGQIAKHQAVMNPYNTFFSVKRFIGRKMTEVDQESKQVSYTVLMDENENVKLDCPALEKQLAAEQISAEVLRKLVDDASRFLNCEVTKAVITVPAYFNDCQRAATKDAGEIAGLQVLGIISEPTAASLAYGFEKNGNQTILVFDLGGGTCDVSVLQVGDGVFEVLSTSGDTHLGGDDFDKRIVNWLTSNFKKYEGIDLLNDKQALQRLIEKAEKAKMELVKAPVQQSMRDAELSFEDIDEVVLVGGSTRIPVIQCLLRKMIGKDLNVTVNPDEVVALGAALQAGVLVGDVRDISLSDVTPLSLGLESYGGVVTNFIPRNTTLPTSKSKPQTTVVDGQRSIRFKVFQGERELAKDNKFLGEFTLDGICPAPRGVPSIMVNFNIDEDGILTVSALDKDTRKEQDITIIGSSTLPRDEVKRMVEEAKKFEKEDKRKREAIDTMNEADCLVYKTEKQLKELGDKVCDAVKDKVEAKLRKLKSAILRGSTQSIKAAMVALNHHAMCLYKT